MMEKRIRCENVNNLQVDDIRQRVPIWGDVSRSLAKAKQRLFL